MAKQLYDYWFVQFDFPNEEGKPYKSSGGKMVWNEALKREIPEGWVDAKLKDLCSIQKDSISPSKTPAKLYRHYSIPEFDKTNSYAKELGNIIQSDKYIVSKNNVLVSKLNPWTSRVIWGIDLPDQVCSTEFVVLNIKNSVLKGFVYSLVKDEKFISYCSQSASGTSHSHRRVTPEIMTNYVFPYEEVIVRKFSQYILNVEEMRSKNTLENNKLTLMRDTLLPLLMNGQVTIKQ